MIEGTLGAFATSTILVAVAEIGDKTQLLSFALAARYHDRMPIIWGILVATLTNHALAGTVGVLAAQLLSPGVTMWVVGASFIAFGIWALFPDKLDHGPRSLRGVFITTLVAFFLAEMGDKTQFATIGLGARYGMPVTVTLGTTLGMMIANVPAVLLGARLAQGLPLSAMRFAAAALFMATGAATLLLA